MFGLNLFYLEIDTLELMLRKVYRAVSFNFEAGKVKLRRCQDVEPAFTEKEFEKVLEKDLYEESRSMMEMPQYINTNTHTNTNSGDLPEA